MTKQVEREELTPEERVRLELQVEQDELMSVFNAAWQVLGVVVLLYLNYMIWLSGQHYKLWYVGLVSVVDAVMVCGLLALLVKRYTPRGEEL